MAQKTPAEKLLDAIAALEQTEDPRTRALQAHALQEAMRASSARVRAITDGAVQDLRRNNWPLAKLAELLGVSVGRVSQMANSRHGTDRSEPPKIFAFRIADEGGGEPWLTDPNMPPVDEYETGFIDFAPANLKNPYVGHRLEVRYGQVPDDGLNPAMQAYTTVNGRRIRLTAALQEFLFTAS